MDIVQIVSATKSSQSAIQANISAKWSHTPCLVPSKVHPTRLTTHKCKPEHKTTPSQRNDNRLQASVCQIDLE